MVVGNACLMLWKRQARLLKEERNMVTLCRRSPLAGALLLGILSTMGCNLMALPFFLMPGMEPRNPAKCKLASDDKNKEVKAAILVSSNSLETSPEFVDVDRALSDGLSRRLQEAFKANKEKVTLVSSSAVQHFKDSHPNWKEMSGREIGKFFHADYLIDLEINSLTLYEQGSFNSMYRGRAAISIAVVDVHNPSDGFKYKEEYSIEYPKSKGPLPADGSNSAQFRQMFLNTITKQLSWRFTSHLIDDEQDLTD
jgi:hypothetical protein